MKAGSFVYLKYAPVVPDAARGSHRAGGRPSWLVRVSQSSSVADPDSPRSFRVGMRRVRYARSFRVRCHRAVKRALSGDSLPLSQDLEEQFSDIPVAADEFGIPEPSASLAEEARRILWYLRPWISGRCLVYLMPDGAVAVDVRGRRPDGVFISIREDGTARCSGEIGGKVWRKPYASSRDVPDDDLLDDLFRLRSGAEAK